MEHSKQASYLTRMRIVNQLRIQLLRIFTQDGNSAF